MELVLARQQLWKSNFPITCWFATCGSVFVDIAQSLAAQTHVHDGVCGRHHDGGDTEAADDVGRECVGGSGYFSAV